MKYIDEFRNVKLVQQCAEKLRAITPSRNINLMEVCGTHTQNFFRFGLDRMLPENVRLIAGPGCPVCVSSQGYIDNAIKFAEQKDAVILTFGDMLRIPGTHASLEQEKARFGNVAVVYSPLDCLKVAKRNPQKQVIFLAVGFETTAPTIALTILAAKKEKLNNLFFYSSLKLIPPAMEYLLQDKRLQLDGFLCPGHVSAIIGTKSYAFIPKRYKIGCCVAGFEPLDILEGTYLLVRQIVAQKPTVENQYKRVVTAQGNTEAVKLMRKVFAVSSASWRGFGNIPESGLRIRKEFSDFDAAKVFSVKEATRVTGKIARCRCPDVLKGLLSPAQCPLFGKSCSPQHPVGPCMVSIEGACNAHFKYRR